MKNTHYVQVYLQRIKGSEEHEIIVELESLSLTNSIRLMIDNHGGTHHEERHQGRIDDQQEAVST